PRPPRRGQAVARSCSQGAAPRATPISSRSSPAVRDARGVLLLLAQQILIGAAGGAADLLVGRAALEREEERLRLRAAQRPDGVEDGPDVLGAALARHLDERHHRAPVADG